MATSTAPPSPPNPTSRSRQAPQTRSRSPTSGPACKKSHIEIPAETVAEQLGSSIDTLMVEAELPGFRKGRAPQRLIESKFGDDHPPRGQEPARRPRLHQGRSRRTSSAWSATRPPASSRQDRDQRRQAPRLRRRGRGLPEFELPSSRASRSRSRASTSPRRWSTRNIDRLCLNEGGLKPKEKAEHGDYLTGHAVMKDDEGHQVILDIQDAVIQIPSADKKGKGMILGVDRRGLLRRSSACPRSARP